MKAYWFDNLPGDQRLPHDSQRAVSPSYLSTLGIIHQQLHTQDEVDAVAQQRRYQHRDEITVSPTALGPAYETKVRTFFDEHLHEDEEIRYILDGAGYFDVRGQDDEWIRLRVEKDDLIVLPAGIYHRFTTDQENYIKALRLFKDEPKWTPLNRSPHVDDNAFRREYLKARRESSG